MGDYFDLQSRSLSANNVLDEVQKVFVSKRTFRHHRFGREKKSTVHNTIAGNRDAIARARQKVD